MSSCICIVTALPAESRPFIDALGLRHQAARGLRLYTGKDFLLLQTGMGKLKAAANTAALLQTRTDIIGLINVGIAGGAQPVGSLHLAHEIKDAATGERWYPHLPPQTVLGKLPTGSVHTVDAPAGDYRSDVLFDMEAAGIFSAASAYLSTDAISSFKLVSDNSDDTRLTVNAASVSGLLQVSVPVVRELGQWLLSRQNDDHFSRQVEVNVRKIRDRVHHTATEQHALRRQIQQYLSVHESFLPDDPVFSLTQAREIRRHLSESLSSASVHYGS